MKRVNWVGAALTGVLLTAGLTTSGRAQDVSIYGGGGGSGEPLQVQADAPRGTLFTLERVPDPAALFTASRDPHRPALPAGTRTVRVASARLSDDTLSFGRVRSGVYLVRAGGVSQVVIVSDLGLVVKRDARKTLLYTADKRSGKTRAARVWALGRGEGAAGEDGRLAWTGQLGPEQVFVARSGDDWAVSGSGWNSYAAPRVRGYVYTDRPVYRPGQHVEFKGVLRQAGSLKPLAGETFTLRVLDDDGDEVARSRPRTDALGNLTGGFDLPAAGVGEYRFEFTSARFAEGELQIGGGFGVEAYQKPEYAVTVTPERPSAVQGEKVSVRISAKYLFRGSVAGARVNYNVTRAPYYPPGFDQDSLPDDGERDYGSDLVVQEEARLNAQGELLLTLPLERDEDGQPVSYRVEAEVEDESRRAVSGGARVLAFPAAVNVQAETDAYVYDTGKTMRVSLDTRDLQERPRAAPVTVDLIRSEWVQGKEGWQERQTRVSRRTGRTDARGRLDLNFTAPRGGGYTLRTTVQDARGRRSVAENGVWVTDARDTWGWHYREMSLQLDRRTYRPGDTATVLVGNPTPGAPVLLTLEGQTLRQSVVLRAAGTTLRYTFRVTPDMTPNIFVAATSLGGGNVHTAEKTLRVPRVGADLKVTVTPDRPRYAPGDRGKLSVQVSDAQGRGVAANVALGVVDGAIYLVRRDDSPDLLRVFDAPRQNAVGTQSSLDFYFQQTGPQAARPTAPMSEAAFAQSKEAEAAADSPQDTPRQDFRDTILWVPNLLTDASGRAAVDVRYPDNLTTWVTTARAQTAQPQTAQPGFGQTTARTLVTKDVIARLSLPTFLVRGDRVTVSGVVNNTLSTPQAGRAALSVSGLVPVSGAALGTGGAALNVAAGGRVRVDAAVRAAQVGTATLTFSARTAGGRDALRLPLPVKARGYEETRTVTGGAGEAEAGVLTVPADANPATVRLSVNLTPSLISAVGPALEYLIGYPYGCTEQTMSRFLPAVLARQTLGSGALPGGGKDLKAITEAGLARLEQFQHGDGGWNFWENDESTLEMTAYVTGGLLRARSAGVRVKNSMLDDGLKYLANHAPDPSARQAERAAAYRVLADAGRVNVARLSAFARRGELTPYSLALTALALNRAGQRQAAQDVLARLKAARQESRGGALVHWGAPQGRAWDWYWDDNDIQVTAVALEALARLDPGSPLIPRVSQWLLSQRRGPQWISTQDTTGVVVAALALPGPPARATNVTVKLDGQAVGSAQVGASGATVSVPAARLTPGAHRLTLEGAPSTLSYAAQLSYDREPARLNARSRGLTLSRRYERLTPEWNAEDSRYTYRRTPLLRGGQLQPVTVGDLILVTVTVTPERAARYVLISDPLPAGMKALDERSLSIAGLKTRGDEWQDWDEWYSGRDLLDDRVDLYAAWLGGPQTMTYLMRAQTPGTFTALPTHGQLMYDPDIGGEGAAATLTVRDR